MIWLLHDDSGNSSGCRVVGRSKKRNAKKDEERARRAVDGVATTPAPLFPDYFFQSISEISGNLFQPFSPLPLRRKSGVAASSLLSMANCGESRSFISSCYCQRRGRETPISPSFLSRQRVLLIERLTGVQLPSHSGIRTVCGLLLLDDRGGWKRSRNKTIYSRFHAGLTFFFSENSKI